MQPHLPPEHTGSLSWDYVVKTGDPLTIWVDRNGDHVDAPAPVSQAAADAIGVAYVCWGRWNLDRRRDSAWERDIRCLIDDDGGRTNRRP